MILQRFLNNTASNAIFSVASTVTSLLVFIILFRIESPEILGQILVFHSILLTLSVLDLGLSTTLEKYIAKYIAQDTPKTFERALSINLCVHAAIGVLGLFTFAALGPFGLLDWLAITIESGFTWVIMGVIALLFWMSRSNHSPLRGLGLYSELNRAQLISMMLGYSLLVISAMLTDKLEIMLVARYSPLMLEYVLTYRSLTSHTTLKFAWPGKITEADDGFWHFSGWSFLTRVSSQIINEFDKALVSIFLGAPAVPVYYGITRVLQIPNQANQIIKSAIVPTASAVHELADTEKYLRFAGKGTTQANLFFSFFAMLVILYAPELLFLIGGDRLTPYTPVVQLSCLLLLPVASRAFLSQALIGAGEVIRLQAIWSVITGIVFLAFFWLGLLHFEVKGGVLARSLSHALMMVPWLLIVLAATTTSISSFSKSVAMGQWPFWAGIACHLTMSLLLEKDGVILDISRIVIVSVSSWLAWRYVLDWRLKHFVVEKLRKGLVMRQ